MTLLMMPKRHRENAGMSSHGSEELMGYDVPDTHYNFTLASAESDLLVFHRSSLTTLEHARNWLRILTTTADLGWLIVRSMRPGVLHEL